MPPQMLLGLKLVHEKNGLTEAYWNALIGCFLPLFQVLLTQTAKHPDCEIGACWSLWSLSQPVMLHLGHRQKFWISSLFHHKGLVKRGLYLSLWWQYGQKRKITLGQVTGKCWLWSDLWPRPSGRVRVWVGHCRPSTASGRVIFSNMNG